MKKGLSILLALTLLMGLVSMGASAAQTQETYSAEGATAFVFSDDGIAVTEGDYSGYKISGTALTISDAGTYTVSGTCADGSIKVKKGTTGVTLILNGLDLTSASTAPLACNKSSAVTIVVSDGTVNTLTDSAQNNDDNYPDNTDAENAVLKCKDGSQVTLCGTGTLNIVSNGKNGIKAGCTTETEGEAWLVIRELTLNITATVNDGINAEQLLTIESGNLTVNAADDGIHCDLTMNIGAEGSEDGPSILIEKSYEGLEAATLNIYGGKITVHATDDGMNAANSDLMGYSFALNIFGGDVYVDAETGDGLDSNGTLTISGGKVEVYSSGRGDNAPLDSDGTFLITGGTVFAVGQRQMAQTPAEGSQTYVQFGGGGFGGPGGGGGWHGPGGPGGNQGASFSIAAGDTIAVTDAEGNTLYSATALRSASYVIYSGSDLVLEGTYSLLVNGNSVATAQCGGIAGSDPTDPPEPPVDPDDPTDPPEPPVNPDDPTNPPEPPVNPDDPTDPPEPPVNPDDPTNPPEPPVNPDDPTDPPEPPVNPGDPTDPPEPPVNPDDPSDPTHDCSAAAFEDVDLSQWYHEAIDYVLKNGLMNGMSSKEFMPDGEITRGMLVTILYRQEGSPEPTGACPFEDVAPGSYYENAITWAAEQGIVTGHDEKTFAPDENITREQLAVILFRYAAYRQQSTDERAELDFTDAKDVSSYASDALAWAVARGLVNGMGDGTLAPQGNATRAQAAAILMRYLETPEE